MQQTTDASLNLEHAASLCVVAERAMAKVANDLEAAAFDTPSVATALRHARTTNERVTNLRAVIDAYLFKEEQRFTCATEAGELRPRPRQPHVRVQH